MRLLYLITRAEPGGAQVHLLELLRGFRDRAELQRTHGLHPTRRGMREACKWASL